MGNSITVVNNTESTVEVVIRFVGSNTIVFKEDLNSKKEKDFHFGFQIGQPKTIILSVSNGATRAVRVGRRVNISQSADNQLKIEVDPSTCRIEPSSEQLKRNKEAEMNWNMVNDESRKNEWKEAANNVIKQWNAGIKYAEGVIGNLVRDIPANKTVGTLASKFVTDSLLAFIKTSEIKYESVKDDPLTKRLKEIQYKLVGISRVMEVDYECLKKSNSLDTQWLLTFLHNQLVRITGSEILPFMEECGLEDVVVVYLFAINLAIVILTEMVELGLRETTLLQRKYAAIFANNLQFIWTNCLEQVAKDSRVKFTGFFVKTASLRYRSDHIYQVKSLWKSRVKKRMKDIQDSFVQNRKYQMDFVFGHPTEMVEKLNRLSQEVTDMEP